MQKIKKQVNKLLNFKTMFRSFQQNKNFQYTNKYS